MVAPSISKFATIPIQEQISTCIDHHSYDDALFLAKLYYEKENCEEALLPLADTMMRANRLNEVYNMLSGFPIKNARLLYLYALCCFQLQKLDECERALTGSCRSGEHILSPVLLNSPSSPFAFNLLSKIQCSTGRARSALDTIERGVITNPLHWSAVQEYLHMGGENPRELFASAMAQLQDEDEPHTSGDKEEEEDCVGTPTVASQLKAPTGAPKKTTRKDPGTETRRDSLRSARHSSTASADVENTAWPSDSANVVAARRPPMPRTSKTTPRILDTISRSPKRRVEPKQPLTSRNSNLIRSSSGSRTRPSTIVTTGREGGASLATPSTSSTSPPSSIRFYLEKIRCLSEVENALWSFDLPRAEELLDKLPLELAPCHHAVLARARILVERAAYGEARKLLEGYRQEHPYEVEGMELLSTVLWHEQDAHSLSSLAVQLTEGAAERAESWCAAANSYSLAKQHSLAVDCLHRAMRLQPRFAYAYTLLGCELIEMEELEKAATAFRGALSVRPRDYRALYGMAMVHQRKEEMKLALVNLRAAIDINPHNSTLLCAESSILQSQGDGEDALEVIERAIAVHPHSIATLYHKARLQYDLRQYSECLETLEDLQTRAPDEANVFFLLGRVHKRLGNTHQALMHFNWASAMDPRGEAMLQDMGEPSEDDPIADR